MAWLSLEEICVWTVVGFAALGWLVLAGIKLNYGRLSSSLAKIYIDPRIGWFVFEVPNLLWAGYFLLRGDSLSLGFLLFIVHYVNRDIIYPLRLKTQTRVPVEIMLSAFCFTAANGYLQGLANAETSNHSILLKTAGVVLFFSGMGINIHSDNILQAAKEKLLKQGDKKYTRIDEFLFQYVANPNYFGEIIEWVGYAIVTGHVYGWLFAFSTVSVLTPAAIVRNRWNKKNISNYPESRKAVFPFLL